MTCVDLDLTTNCVNNSEASSGHEDDDSLVMVTSCLLSELFSGVIYIDSLKGEVSGNLVIPEYQRSYVWSEKQLTKLIDNLREFNSSYNQGNPLYYLGSIILHLADNKLNIIDGQQRITSLLLLYAVKMGHYPCSLLYSSPSSLKRIADNLQFLDSLKSEIPEIDLSLLNITLVITKNEDDAYTFFETQNTGGKRLSGPDIIKSHHLRAINSKSLVALNARKWESANSSSLSYVVSLLAKARLWNVLYWKDFPFYKNKVAIKNTVVEEFTERTSKEALNISYFQAESHHHCIQSTFQFNDHFKAIRQPLYDGENYVDFLSEFVGLYETLFKKKENQRVDARFYEFRDRLINGREGTVFLKELYEIALISFVSKFGLQNIFEVSLWLFRYVYSLRVSTRRTVRENTMVNFVKEQRLIDMILASFRYQDVIDYLKGYSYNFNDENCSANNVKGRYIKMLVSYFESHSSQNIVITDFDKTLKKAIEKRRSV